MKFVIFIIFLPLSLINPSIKKNEIYDALSSKSIVSIENMLQQLENVKSTSLNQAYKGALLTKKANFEKKVEKKITLFKSGVQLLESEIKSSPKEIEYRFLRVCIQENCPKILKYNKNINEDVQLIINNFSKQSKNLKTIIISYSKTSKSLDTNLLK